MIDEAIERAVLNAVESGTFTVKAVEGIKALREENVALRKENESRRVNLEVLEKRRADLTAELEKANSQIKFWAGMHESLEKREKEVTRIECSADKHKAVADAVQLCFAQVFKNPIVQETLMRSSSHQTPAGQLWDSGTDTTRKETNP